MPATRTAVVRQGNRAAPMARQASIDVRLATPEIISISSGDESRPFKKLALEKKSARQRSKQKARAPLPPASEIIEISSDDDAPLPKRPSGSMSTLERRIKELEEFLSAVDEHISCEICTMKMWNPYTLACGHTFCKDCLQDWFSTALAQHMATHPHYNPQAMIPHHWRALLARPDLSHHQRREVERQISMLAEATPQPAYSCPTCRVEVRNKPAETFVVKHLVRTVAGAQGESCPKIDLPPRLGHPPDGPWDGFFPFSR
ncbi:hypothetical protein BD413DRAFT_604785 [Trametes elegans]|nr:hypothetical protein BD413DRAFT_604785 [Trametes elegans]